MNITPSNSYLIEQVLSEREADLALIQQNTLKRMRDENIPYNISDGFIEIDRKHSSRVSVISKQETLKVSH